MKKLVLLAILCGCHFVAVPPRYAGNISVRLVNEGDSDLCTLDVAEPGHPPQSWVKRGVMANGDAETFSIKPGTYEVAVGGCGAFSGRETIQIAGPTQILVSDGTDRPPPAGYQGVTIAVGGARAAAPQC